MGRLERKFLEALGERPRGSLADLEPLLAGAWQAGRDRWSALEPVDAERFVSWIAARVEPGTRLRAALEKLHAADLYLACACAGRDEKAYAALEESCFAEVDAAARRLGTAEFVDEVKQRLRELLFLGEKPRIVDYAGRGELKSWIRVTAGRLALRLAKAGAKEAAEEPKVLDAVPWDADDPELSLLKSRYRDAFKRALEESFAALEPGERTILRQHLLDGLTIDQLAGLYRIHRATAARRVQSAREAVLSGTRRALSAELKLGKDEFSSLYRLVQSQIDVSLSRVLRSKK